MSEAQKMTGNQPGSGSKSEVNKKSEDKSCESQKDKILRKEEKVLKALEDENLKGSPLQIFLSAGHPLTVRNGVILCPKNDAIKKIWVYIDFMCRRLDF